tara:strand:- start:2202 stop:2951 length:750 start_codon:yes stop_codon:yes gene_type:complete
MKMQAQKRPNITAFLNSKNVGHGPALHQGAALIHTRLAFMCDTDCLILKNGFLEQMMTFFEDSQTYAVGKITQATPDHRCLFLRIDETGEPYCRTNYMLIDIHKYHTLAPFTHHGAPAIYNFRHARSVGYKLVDYPIDRYIVHAEKGTRSKYNIPGWKAFEPGIPPNICLRDLTVSQIGHKAKYLPNATPVALSPSIEAIATKEYRSLMPDLEHVRVSAAGLEISRKQRRPRPGLIVTRRRGRKPARTQ